LLAFPLLALLPPSPGLFTHSSSSHTPGPIPSTASLLLTPQAYTDKKENKIFLIYKEILSGAVAKSYMRKCENISLYMRTPLVIYNFATAPF
jgi:hypothetical protein